MKIATLILIAACVFAGGYLLLQGVNHVKTAYSNTVHAVAIACDDGVVHIGDK